MKTILIERVSNGFIVRPFTPSSEWMGTDREHIAVYKTAEELATDLPKLLVGVSKTETEI